MAPEMLLQAAEGYNFAVDWWTLGLFLCEMLTGRHPFKGENHYTTLRNIVSPQRAPYIDHRAIMFARGNTERKSLGPEAIHCIRAFLQRDPAMRLGSGASTNPAVQAPVGLEEIKCVPFFQGLDWDMVTNKEYRPGIIPDLDSDTDIRNFDAVFTREAAVDSVAPEDKKAADAAAGAAGGGGGFFGKMFSRSKRGVSQDGEAKKAEVYMPPVSGVPDQAVFDDFNFSTAEGLNKDGAEAGEGGEGAPVDDAAPAKPSTSGGRDSTMSL
jgi:serine/threonine protein kinase